MNLEKFQSCIDACNACTTECERCISQCLDEKEVKMFLQCMELSRQTAVVCRTVSTMLAIGGQYATLLCKACAELCELCAKECEKYADRFECCKTCATACRKCADECLMMASQRVSASQRMMATQHA